MFGFDLDYDYEDGCEEDDPVEGTFGYIKPGEKFLFKTSIDKENSICTKLKDTILYKNGYGTSERMANAIDGEGNPFYISDLTIVSLPEDDE